MKRLSFALLLLASTPLFAQPLLRVPQASPRARVEETFGITDVAVEYHRPAVNKRRIWGGLVPYDVVWRAGANESTLVTFSTPVKVEGQAVPAGTYSLFMIPSASQWTVVLNRFTGGWGTYAYDAGEDVLRVKVTPQAAEAQERLAYTFDDAKNDAVTLSMRWEKLRVPLKIEAETTKLTLAGIEGQLRGSLHWVPQAWTEAARFALRNGETDKALAFINHGMSLTPDAQSMRVKAAIVEKKGDPAQAKELRERAAALVPEASALNRGYELHFAKKYDEAIAFVNDYLAKHPSNFRAHSLLGMIHTAKGDAAKAKASFDKATSLAKDQSERVEVWDAINALAAGEKQ
jgi:TolA-binding protein